MGTVRVRENGSVELRVKHRQLARPYYSTHETEEQARAYDRWLTPLLDRGEIPPELAPRKNGAGAVPLAPMLAQYLESAPVAKSDRPLVEFLSATLKIVVSDVTVLWADAWIKRMKTEDHLAPGTIRKRVECLARAIDWWNRRTYGPNETPTNPLRTLPTGYSSYRDTDAPQGKEARRDVERNRRLLPGEEAVIENAVCGVRRENRQRALEMQDAEAFLLLWRLIVNTGLRLREAYRLKAGDVRFDLRTIHVAQSKTGAARDVPMTRQVHDWLKERQMPGSKDALIFPFWDGDEDSLARVSNRLSHAFARVFDYAGCEDLTEHDLRHEATCRWMEMKDAHGRWLFRPEEVRKITGHKTEKMFMRYLSLRGSDLAERLW